MEMWCPGDFWRDSWDWVGPPAWERACFNSPEMGGGSSPVKTEPPQIVLLLLLCVCCVWCCGREVCVCYVCVVCVGGREVCVLCVCCVCGWVRGGGMLRTRPLCVHSKRPRVYPHHVHMFYTCGRGATTHGDV